MQNFPCPCHEGLYYENRNFGIKVGGDSGEIQASYSLQPQEKNPDAICVEVGGLDKLRSR
jgi:hypothetical protein